jgi:L-lactate dehydrogenase complex protein LldF
VQLGQDRPSHIVVPALHKNRREIRDLFAKTMGLPDLGDDPAELTNAARMFLRERFLRVPAGFSGANFLIADTGGVCVVESEGNGRMCVTLPDC